MSATRLVWTLNLATLLASSLQTAAQVSSYSVHRQKWITQVATNPIPFAYRFSVNVTGVGTLKGGEIRAPLATNALSGGTMQLSFATNFMALVIDGTNVLTGLELMTASYPTGPYTLNVQSKIGPTFLTTNISVDLSRDFPPSPPVITNAPPWMGLEATQEFAWAAFSTNPLAYTRFYLLEGDVDTNLLASVMSSGIDALTNTMSIVAVELNLPASQTSLTVSGIDTSEDHLAILEFFDPAVAGGAGGLSEAGTISGGMIFYYALRIVAQPQSLTVQEGQPAAFNVAAVGSRPITYQWKFKGAPIANATNAMVVLSAAKVSDAGEYTVVVSNAGASQESLPAALTVTPATAPQPKLLVPRNENGLDLILDVEGIAGATYSIEASEDLVTWRPIGQVSTPGGTGSFTDPGALTLSLRFYRATQVN